MLIYDLSKKGNVPIYDYLYTCIRTDIQEGKITAGEKLPSKRELSTHLNISINTVAAAYEQLISEGYIRTEERRGYYVEEVSGYKLPAKPKNKAAQKAAVVQSEKNFFADFKANRPSTKLFPASIWSRYMREALSTDNRGLLEVVPYNGLYELRYEISEYLHRVKGMEISPEQVIIGAGTEYLYGRLMQLFGRETIFAIEDPGYKKFADISATYGNPWRYVPIDDSGLIIDELEESGADVVHLSPANHFPTGTIMPVTRRLQLFEWANRAKKRYIIEDDYDSEFRYSGRFIPPLFTEDVMDKVIYMNSFSKTLVPSIRISYMVLPTRLLKRFENTMSFYSCTVSSYEQYALARFIGQGHLERHISRLKKYYSKQRILMIQAIKESPLNTIAEIKEKNAGTHFLLRVDTALTDEEIRKKAEDLDINISLLSDYSYEKQSAGNAALIINYARIDREHIGEIVKKLEDIFMI